MRILKTWAVLISSIAVMTLIMNGCKNKYAVEAAAIDSLIAKNKMALDNIKIDLITINERRNEMKGQIAILQKVQPDSSGLEFAMNFDKYKSIYKLYNKFIENYDVIFNRVRFNEKQLATLKNSLIDEKITGTEFRIALNKERINVEDNLINAQTFGGRITQLEPDYQRLSNYFDPQIEGLVKQFPELKKLIEKPAPEEEDD